MKNKMKKIFKLCLFIFLSSLILNKQIIADEFNFEGEEIQILNDGNLLVSKNGIKIETDDYLIITAEELNTIKKN